jgi:hypothetical protein
MGLLNNLLKGARKEDDTEHIAVILFRQNEGIGYVCKVNHTKQSAEILDERGFVYSNAWENLVYDVDELLFNFENTHNIKLNKAVFFVYSHLVDPVTGSLKEPYLQSFKEVIKENKLESLGYIELEESLAQVYTRLEQSPLNAVLIEVDAASVSVFVYQGGQKSFANTIAKTENIIADLEELFKRTEKGMLLPARVLMYDSPTVESESHVILTHAWQENVFIQIPKVDVVRDFEINQAVIHGVMQEMFGAANMKPLPAMQDIGGQMEVAEPAQDEAPAAALPTKSKTPDSEQDTEMGFVIGADIRDQEEKEAHASETAYPDELAAQVIPVEAQPPSEPIITPSTASSKNRVMTMITTIKMKSMNLLSSLKAGNSRQRTMKIVLLISGLIFLVGSIFVTLFFFHKATLTVLYKSDPIEDTLTFSDEDQFEKFTNTFSVSATIDTTGTQDIGDKASGEITIFNADEDERTFDKGTKLQTTDGLVFVLDEEVTVDGAKKTITEEGDVLASTSKVQTTATASEIGPKHNIKKDTKLTFDGLSSTTYFARADAAFTGGTSKEVQTVARADYAKIDAMIASELAKKSKAQLQKISTRGNIIDDLTLIDDKKQTYSKEISEEAKSLTSKATAKVSFYAYDDTTVKEAILESFQQDIPDGYSLKAEDITYEIASAERNEKNGRVSMDVEAKAEPTLKVDEKQLVESVKGASLESIRDELQDRFNASGYKAEVDSPVPFLRSRLPWFPQNISVELRPMNQ